MLPSNPLSCATPLITDNRNRYRYRQLHDRTPRSVRRPSPSPEATLPEPLENTRPSLGRLAPSSSAPPCTAPAPPRPPSKHPIHPPRIWHRRLAPSIYIHLYVILDGTFRPNRSPRVQELQEFTPAIQLKTLRFSHSLLSILRRCAASWDDGRAREEAALLCKPPQVVGRWSAAEPPRIVHQLGEERHRLVEERQSLY